MKHNNTCGVQGADRYRVIEEADAEIAARQPEREPHYLRPIQASLLDSPGVRVPFTTDQPKEQ